MTLARSVCAVFSLLALFAFVTPADAQDREYIRLLEKLLVGASGAINAEITGLRRQLARCDGPPNLRLPSDNCATRTLVQARLNYLLRMGMSFGDPDTAGTPPRTVPTAPPDLTDFRNLRASLFEKVRAEPTRDIVHVISEDRARLAIVYHCAAMHDFDANGLKALMSDAELAAHVKGQARINATVNACIGEYDAREVSTNRKAAIEYCFQSNNYVTDPSMHAWFDACMDTRDMIQAMCKQEFEQATAYMYRRLPGRPRPVPVTCSPDRAVRPNASEIKAILSASAPRTMAELPATFLAVPPPPLPDPRYPTPGPPVPIPAGTVVDATLIGGVFPAGVGQGVVVQARLDRPLVIGGQTVLPIPNVIDLKARILGPGARPDSVQIGFSTYWAYSGMTGGYELTSNELVFTVARRGPAPAGLGLGVPPDTKLRFTLGSTASSPALAAGTSTATPPARPASAPPTSATPPAAAPPPSSGPQDRQQQAEERRRQTERRAACVQQAMKDHPRGGVELTQALTACAQAK
jgi:hypothetical protein